MKYIDADKLIAEIERLKATNPSEYNYQNAEGYIWALDDIKEVIDSLQQEQPDFPTTDEQIKEFLATHPKVDVPQKYKTPDWLWKQEQPEVDLMKEIDEYMSCEDNNPFDWDWRDKQACARHFYELGRQAKPEIFDTVAFQKGVEEGRRLEREDALTIADIEKLHTFLYAIKNNKHGVFTFTRLSDEQYEEVLQRFNNAKEK